ncbi:MAG: hypothetical protein WB609_12020 [Candidatus Cybelea sp.]
MKVSKADFSRMDSLVADASVCLFAAEDTAELHDFDGRDHWFSPTVQRALAAILYWSAHSAMSELLRPWFEVALSRIINRVSRQDSETRYVAREKPWTRAGVMELFLSSLMQTRDFLQARGPLNGDATIELADTSLFIPLPDASVDLIITSPPYANSMDYYLYHKQRMNILGYSFKKVQSLEIGSRWEFSSLKRGVDKWRNQYTTSLREFRRILKAEGRCVVIIGDSQIAGELVDSASLTETLGRSVGFRVSHIQSQPLENRSRSFTRGFQRPNKMEHTIILAPS